MSAWLTSFPHPPPPWSQSKTEPDLPTSLLVVIKRVLHTPEDLSLLSRWWRLWPFLLCVQCTYLCSMSKLCLFTRSPPSERVRNVFFSYITLLFYENQTILFYLLHFRWACSHPRNPGRFLYFQHLRHTCQSIIRRKLCVLICHFSPLLKDTFVGAVEM